MKPASNPAVSAKPSLISAIRLNWKPQPLSVPKVVPAFREMDSLQRVGEVLRYSTLKLECWLSPNGKLREWLRFNVVIGCVLSIPALLVVPLVTYLLGQFATWSALLGTIATNLIIFPLTVIGGIALLSAMILFTRVLVRR